MVAGYGDDLMLGLLEREEKEKGPVVLLDRRNSRKSHLEEP